MMNNKDYCWTLRQAHKFLVFAAMYTDIEEEADKLVDLRIATHDLLKIAEDRYEKERKKGS